MNTQDPTPAIALLQKVQVALSGDWMDGWVGLVHLKNLRSEIESFFKQSPPSALPVPALDLNRPEWKSHFWGPWWPNVQRLINEIKAMRSRLSEAHQHIACLDEMTGSQAARLSEVEEVLALADDLSDQVDIITNPKRVSELANPTDEGGLLLTLCMRYETAREKIKAAKPSQDPKPQAGGDKSHPQEGV